MSALRVNLITERAMKRISQSGLADRSGVSRPTISRIERGTGDASVEVVERLAIALGVSVSALFEGPYLEPVDDAELLRRANAPRSDVVEAQALFDALDEAGGRPIRRYSKAGRPPATS